MRENGPHHGRVAWVTGGASGIGAATVELLRADGATVAALDVHAPTADVPWRHCDISDSRSAHQATAALRQETGPCDILINNAGMNSTAPLPELSDEAWAATIGVNLTGAMHMMRETMPHMIEQRWGRIVSVTSSSAIRVTPTRAAYAASKAGLIALAKVAATEGAPFGVTSNIVAPGVTETPMTVDAFGTREALVDVATNGAIGNPMGVLLEPIDIAQAIRFFTLPEARYITGDLVYVNAGSVMS